MDTGKITLEVISPQGLVVKKQVDEVNSIPGSEGEFGVLPGHMCFVTTLKIGVLSYKSSGSEKYVFINSGYAEVSASNISILADSAEKAEDIDVERAIAAKQRAEERLEKEEKIDFARATAALERATARIQIAKR
ncbi:MAG: F0F1 ATP synthase subunit epsilon [Dissulfurispiraceae bacterium]|jgi:F-type H+-transporting ATPase subunit epsilon|nr:F0F1 ATP synthase subunit epsilon [Dissulfurispiraceae bacterium]